MNNEMETRKILPKFGFVVPEIKECIGRTITMERVYGENLHDLYKIEDIHNIEKISEEIGRRVKTMHDSGYALIDFAIENLMKTKNGMLVNYDGEYFTKNATEFEKINDKVTYIVSCLGLDSERYRATVKDFLDGYGENLTYTDILFISLFSGLYPLSFKENGYEFINRMRNPRSIMDLNHVRASL
jgi:tRNA A-37 threonylcarbamoyl transferase component Bud32